MKNENQSNESTDESGVASSDLLDDLGLEKLLEYIASPRKYVREALMTNPDDDDMEDYEAWAASRARHILERLSSSNDQGESQTPTKTL